MIENSGFEVTNYYHHQVYLFKVTDQAVTRVYMDYLALHFSLPHTYQENTFPQTLGVD